MLRPYPESVRREREERNACYGDLDRGRGEGGRFVEAGVLVEGRGVGVGGCLHEVELVGWRRVMLAWGKEVGALGPYCSIGHDAIYDIRIWR
jgi:hypothetical protein